MIHNALKDKTYGKYFCSDLSIYLSISGIVKGLIWTLGH
jgi:hypothetical protein